MHVVCIKRVVTNTNMIPLLYCPGWMVRRGLSKRCVNNLSLFKPSLGCSPSTNKRKRSSIWHVKRKESGNMNTGCDLKTGSFTTSNTFNGTFERFFEMHHKKRASDTIAQVRRYFPFRNLYLIFMPIFVCWTFDQEIAFRTTIPENPSDHLNRSFVYFDCVHFTLRYAKIFFSFRSIFSLFKFELCESSPTNVFP